MCTKDFRSTKAITLIALIISIIVLLILAGVSIVTLTGDNGLLTRTVGAKNKTTLAAMEEELNLVYMSVYTGKAGTGAINSGVSLDEIYNDVSLPSEIKSHIIQIGNANTIRLREGSQSSVTILAEYGAITSNGTPGTNTVNIEIEEVSNSNVYWLESEGVYYPMSIANSRVVLDKENTSTTEPTGTESTGNEIGIAFLDNGAETATENSNFITKTTTKSGNITTITLIASSAGSTQVIVKKGNGTEVGGRVEIGVTVTPVYTINLGDMTNGSVGIKTNNIVTATNAKYASGTQIELTATGDEGYTFEKWADDNSTPNIIPNPRTIEVNSTTSAATYTAEFKIKSYVGYYIKKGDKFAIIYVDLVGQTKYVGGALQSGSVTVPNSATTGKNFKSYVVTNIKHTDSHFGTNYIIDVATDNEGTDDRFIAMALNDADENTNTWWNWLFSNSSYLSTSYEIGAGKTNSETVKVAWNTNTSGQNTNGTYTDIWSLITLDANNKATWFIPSNNEWKAFGAMSWTDNAETPITRTITSSNYSGEQGYGLSQNYWTSSQDTSSNKDARTAYFNNGYILGRYVHYCSRLRLSTTF